MRWASFRDQAKRERVGVLRDGELYALEPGNPLVGLLAGGREALREAGERALARPVEVVPLDAVNLLAPVPRPPSVRDFYAFEEHVRTARKRRGLDMDPD